MTLKELSEVYYLSEEIKHDKKLLRMLRNIGVKTTKINGMPFAISVIYDPIAENVATIIDLERALKRNIAKRLYEKRKIMAFINNIDDCFIRLIFKLRFIECKNWRDVAKEIGGGNTVEGVKKKCYRFLNNG